VIGYDLDIEFVRDFSDEAFVQHGRHIRELLLGIMIRKKTHSTVDRIETVKA